MQPIRVLVVDDEKDFASAIADRLNKRGFDASAAFGGRKALEYAQSCEYDSIVIDLQMPDMDGLQTLQAIRKIDTDLQVIVLTGHGTVSAGIGGMQLGAADFLQKPIAIEKLCKAIDAAAERTRSNRDLKKARNIKDKGETK